MIKTVEGSVVAADLIRRVFKYREAMKLKGPKYSFPKLPFSHENLEFYHWYQVLSTVFRKVTGLSHFKKMRARNPMPEWFLLTIHAFI